MRRALAGLVIAGMVTGCTGTFALTRKVYDFHRSQTNKWMDEFLFLVVYLLPVYGIASLVDGVILNSIEFWSGTNPMATSSAAEPDGHHKTAKAGDQELLMSYDPATDQITMTSPAARGALSGFVLARGPEGVTAKDAEGRVLLSSVTTADGGIEVRNRQRHLVKRYSARDVQRLKERALPQ